MNYTQILLKYSESAIDRHYKAHFLYDEIMKECGTEGVEASREKVAQLTRQFFRAVRKGYFAECDQCKYCKIIYKRALEVDLTQLEKECRETLFSAAQAFLRDLL